MVVILIFLHSSKGKNKIKKHPYFSSFRPLKNKALVKKNGYVTCLSNSECYRESVRTKHNMTQEEICDYEMINCDPNTMNLLDLKKRCLYDK